MMYRKQTNPILYFLAIALVTSSTSTVFATPDMPIYNIAESCPQYSIKAAIWNKHIATQLAAMQVLEEKYPERPQTMVSIKDFSALWQSKKASILHAIINLDAQYTSTEKASDRQGENIEHQLVNILTKDVLTSVTCRVDIKPDSLSSIIKAFNLSLSDSANLLLAINEIGISLTRFSKRDAKDDIVDTREALGYIDRINEQTNTLCSTVRKFIESLKKESAADKVTELNSIDPDSLKNHKYLARFILVVKNHFTNTTKEEKQIAKLNDLVKKLSHQLYVQKNYKHFTNNEIVWQITDFDRKKQQAIAQENVKIKSPPFFTKDGRKFDVSAYLTGNSYAEDTHLSVYFKVRSGPQDNLLSWPFAGWRVIFSLIDQTEQKKHLYTDFITSSDSTSYSKPINDNNPGIGFPDFVPLSRLKKLSPYIDAKQDSIVIKVTIEEPTNKQ